MSCLLPRALLVRRALTRKLCTQSESVATARLNEARAGAVAISSLATAYTDLLTAYPLRANALISGTLCAVGDTLAQSIEMRLDVAESKAFDPLRVARMAIYGTLICGPLLHGWYSTLHVVGEAFRVSHVPVLGSRLSALLPGLGSLQKEVASGASPVHLLAAKVAADGLFFQAPFLNLYFASMGLLEGRPLGEIYEKTRLAFHRAWGLSLLVWTPVQLLNLSLVPVSLQPAVVSAVNVGWKATLSLLNAIHDTSGQEGLLRRRSSMQITTLTKENAALAAQVATLREENERLLVEMSGMREQLVDVVLSVGWDSRAMPHALPPRPASRTGMGEGEGEGEGGIEAGAIATEPQGAPSRASG